VNAAPSGQDLLGRLQPAHHDHGPAGLPGSWRSATSRTRTASARTNAGPPSSTDSNWAASSTGSRRVNLISRPRG
jgi:hypothetical protein